MSGSPAAPPLAYRYTLFEDEPRPFADLKEAIRHRAVGWNSSLRPCNAVAAWMVDQVALLSVRLEQVTMALDARGRLEARRLASQWNIVRELEAYTVIEKLAARPAATVRKLQCSLQGCVVLIEE